VKPDTAKEGAAVKTDGADAGSAKPKADAVKTGARTKKAATKSRATRSARR
jgi:hypothetical protein